MHYDSTRLTPAECELVDWQYSQISSDFKRPLWEAIMHADRSNQLQLSYSFPKEVQAYLRFSTEPGYWEDVLCRAGIIE